MANLSLKHIYKVYPNGTKAVNDFTMDIEDQEFIVFVGPSGCGKSTTLRMIAGLEEISAGELKIGDVVVNDAEPKERDIAMVFQNYALYPHMTIFDNIAFGLKMRKTPKNIIKEKVEAAAKTLGITEYLDKKPKEMSGGQRQRVALGRAIVREPKVMLLDEPLSNLDAKLRTQMRSEIVKLHDKLKTTFIYVTHDQVEAMTMGTRIVVMKDGFIKQIDTPKNLYLYPDNKFVAGFIGTPQMNFLEGVLNSKDGETFVTLNSNGLKVIIPNNLIGKMTPKYLHQATNVIIGIRPEDITFEKEEGHQYVGINLEISHNEELGTETLVYTNIYKEGCDSSELPRVIVKSKAFDSIKTGTKKEAYINIEKMHIFDSESEENIIPRLPKSIYLKCEVTDEKLDILGKKCPKLDSISLKSGKCEIVLPLDSVVSGTTYKGKILGVEEINHKYLYRLSCNKEILYMLKDEIVEDSEISFDIDLKEADFKYEDEIIYHLDLENKFDSTFNLTYKKGIKLNNASKGDTLILDIKGYINDELIKDSERLNLELILDKKSLLPGLFKKLKGSNPNDVIEYKLTFSGTKPEKLYIQMTDEEYATNLANKEAKFVINIKEVKSNKLTKVKEYSYEMLNHKFVVDQEFAQKMFNAYTNRTVFNTLFSCLISPYDIHIDADAELEGEVTNILHIGNEKFAVVDFEGHTLYVFITDELITGSKVRFSISTTNMSVIEQERNIRII